MQIRKHGAIAAYVKKLPANKHPVNTRVTFYVCGISAAILAAVKGVALLPRRVRARSKVDIVPAALLTTSPSKGLLGRESCVGTVLIPIQGLLDAHCVNQPSCLA